MYKRILVPLDGSPVAEQALPFAQIIARPLLAKIELLRVFSPPSSDLLGQDAGIYLDQIAASFKSQSEDYLEEKAITLRESGFSVETAALEGEAADVIVDEAAKTSETLIAMSSRGRSGLSRMIMGSVADKVLRTTSDPLFLINSRNVDASDNDLELSELIVPLDGSSLAEQVLPHVVSLSKGLDLQVTLLRAIPTSAEYAIYIDYPPPNVDELLQEVESNAAEYLEKMSLQVSQLGAAKVKTRLVHGSPGEAICDYAQETRDCAVAMTTHGRSGLGRWVMGSVTDRVVRHSQVPVLIVRAFDPDAD